ncbi:MAG: chitinase [Flavobacteriales bacterium]|jgi:chitinase
MTINRNISVFLSITTLAFSWTSVQAYECSGLATWNDQSVYTASNEVQLDEQAYAANWWTQGQNPTTNSAPYSVWSGLGSCDGGGDGDGGDGDGSTDTGSCAGVPMWNATTAYTSGQEVVQSGVSYRANWWTQGTNPSTNSGATGSGQPWTVLVTCGDDGDVNVDPVAEANGPYSANLSSAIQFSSSGSSDSDGSIVSYSWSFGDGSSSAEQNPSHSYANTGSFSVTLTVVDNQGASHSDSASATISADGDININPVAEANGPYSANLGSSIQFSGAGSSDNDGVIVSYSWSFGDGNTSTQQSPSHSYANTGSYNVTLTVVDNQGASHSDSANATIGDDQTPTGDKKIIGYFTEWGVYGRNYHVKNLVSSGSADKLTHIMYAFGNVTNGECQIGDSFAAFDKFYDASQSVDGVADTWDTGALRGNFNQLRKLKQMYPNIKVVWSFGGWTWSGGFGQASANPEAFANSCYDLVNDSRWSDVFDGIDIDWEYPNDCGLSCDTSGYDAYGNLMSALRQRFGTQLVTSAITASATKMNSANYGLASQYLDFFMVMTYDFFGAFAPTGPTAPHSALYDYPGMPQAGFSSDTAVQTLKGLGVPADKILLGIGFYGRGWTGVNQAAPGGAAGGAAAGTYEAGIEDYKVLRNSCPSTGTIAGTAYAYCGNNWWGYDTPATVTSKMDYAKQQGLGGSFFWEFSGDTDDGELIKAIADGLD